MFSGLMANAWVTGTLLAAIAGVVGFFVVLRGSTFVAHAVPLASFAGAAGAGALGVSSLAGLALFAPVTALSIGWLGRRRRHDVVTALVVATMLGLGALFMSWTQEYSAAIYALLFGQIVGVTTTELWLTAVLATVALLAVSVMYRPLLLTSVTADLAEARGLRPFAVDMAFLVLVAIVTAMSVPVVGALLMFTLMVGPAAAARALVRGPLGAITLSAGLAVATAWVSIAAAYATNWPIGFFVGVSGAAWYVMARAWSAIRH